MKKYAYLDIETTGYSRNCCEITVVGMAIQCGNKDCRVVQLFGDQATDIAVMKALAGVERIYTYNGSRFDLPFIKTGLGLDLKGLFPHTDLMYACWKKNLKGGLKAVERRLGIVRELKDVDGWMAIKLWWDYVNNANLESLRTLLAYNAEDVVNLRTLREYLRVE